MTTLLLRLCLIMFALASGCSTAQIRDETNQRFAMHQCTKNPFLRASGLFGGVQPEIFLSGPNVRNEPPPAANSLTRVLKVTGVENLGDPSADPIIDKCSSWLQRVDADEVKVTIIWNDRHCPDSIDDEDSIDCSSRASFRFSLRHLGMEEVLGRFESSDDAIQRLLAVDAYFLQEMQPARRHFATNMPLRQKSTMHLVVRLMPAPPTMESEAATTADTISGSRGQF